MENDSSVNFQLTIRKQRTWKIMQLHRDVMPPARLFVAASLIILSRYGKPRKIRKLQILAKIILHSICVLNYAKVYLKHNIFHKKSKYMIFHVLSNKWKQATYLKYGFQNFGPHVVKPTTEEDQRKFCFSNFPDTSAGPHRQAPTR